MGSIEKYARMAEKIDLFKGLDPDDVRAIIKLGDRREFFNGQHIFHEGQIASNLFIVLHGQVHLYVRTELIAKCRAGDTFGEMAALTHAPHTSTAVASGDTKVFVLDEKEIAKTMSQRAAVRLLLNAIHLLSLQLETAFSHHTRLKNGLERRQPNES